MMLSVPSEARDAKYHGRPFDNGEGPFKSHSTDKRRVITSGARSAERVYFYIPEKSQYERPAGRPAVVTLFERLFLWNGMTNSRMVILIRCHHPINHVFDRYRCPPVPATARGTCRGEGVEDTLSLGNSTTAGPIAFKFGVWLGTH